MSTTATRTGCRRPLARPTRAFAVLLALLDLTADAADEALEQVARLPPDDDDFDLRPLLHDRVLALGITLRINANAMEGDLPIRVDAAREELLAQLRAAID